MDLSDELIYKICTIKEWEAAKKAEFFSGTPLDIKDGYIHFSTSEQVVGTLAKHYPKRADLLLVAVDSKTISMKDIKWEPARNGSLFPHLYRELRVDEVVWVNSILLNEEGVHFLK